MESTRLSGRSRMGQALGVQIAATGSYVPSEIVTNEDLAALGCDSEWIVRRTGILERRRAAAAEATSDLAYEAAIRCMRNAGVTANELDLILVATITPDHPTPSTACHLQRRLGAIAPAMDINAACAGFMYGLVTGAQFVRAGNAARVLVVGADVMSRTIDPRDIKTFPLFGDGAGAALLTPDQPQGSGLLAYTLGSEGCGGEMLCIPGGGSREMLTPDRLAAGQQYLRMDGRNVFKWAVRVIAESTLDVLSATSLASSDLDLLILHQANQRIIDSAADDLAVDRERIFVNLERYGNTSAASIPLALDEAVHAGRIQRGNHVLMCGFGAGLAWGTSVLRW
jgi:3-oxoacyl-[acyl-carrier-protein] synthase III